MSQDASSALDSVIKEGGSYKENVHATSVLAEALDTIAKMDTTEELLAHFAPLAFQAVERLLVLPSLQFEFTNKAEIMMIEACRNEAVCILLSIYPLHKEIRLPIAIAVVNRILHGASYPEEMKQRARAVLLALGIIDRDSIINSSTH